PRRCKEDLFRWRPIRLRLQVGSKLIPQMIARGRADLVIEACEQRLVPRPWRLMLLVPLALAGKLPSNVDWAEELDALCVSSVPDFRDNREFSERSSKLSFLETILVACEISYASGVAKSRLEAALELVLKHRASPRRALTYTEPMAID